MSISNETETEADTRAKRIGPVLAAAGWGLNNCDVQPDIIISPEFLKGSIYER